MATLKEDIKKQSDWIIKAFAADKLKLDYTIHSFIEIDKFFNKHSKNGQPVKRGRLSNNLGPIIFSIGAYVWETIIKTLPKSVWQTDDKNPEGEFAASIKLQDETIIWPMQRVLNRFKNGSEDSVYVYGHEITKGKTKEPFDQSYWDIGKITNTPASKPWWKFW